MNAEQAIDLKEKLKAVRSTLESHWQECADYGLPSQNQIHTKHAEGAKKDDLFDTTAEESIMKAAAGLYSYMFPADNKAFVLTTDDEMLREIDTVKQWLSKATDILHDYFIKTNFRMAFFQFLKSLLCFGTASLYIDKGKKLAINYLCHPIWTVYFTEDAEGNVDQVLRVFELTSRQAIEEFGKENLHNDIVSNSDPTKKFEFLHAVYPRKAGEYTDGEILNKKRMRYAEKYFDVANKLEIEEGGHPEQPYIIDRFDRDPMELHGRSPMMKKLPDIKMINAMKKVRIKAWEKMCDPPVIVPNDGSVWPLATQPGGVIFRTGDASIDYFEFKGNLQGMEEAIADERGEIRTGFFVDIFEPLVDHKNMTAFEVDERKQEKLRMTIPTVGQRQSSLFNPLVERSLGLLVRAGKVPPPPIELLNQDYSVQYLGQIALSLKTLEVLGWMKVLEQIDPIGNFNPDKANEIMDNFEVDLVYRDSARNNGVPATWLKSEEDVLAERELRKQAVQAQMAMDKANDLSKAFRNMAVAPEEGSPAQELVA